MKIQQKATIKNRKINQGKMLQLNTMKKETNNQAKQKY